MTSWPWTLMANGISSLQPKACTFVFCKFTSNPSDAASLTPYGVIINIYISPLQFPPPFPPLPLYAALSLSKRERSRSIYAFNTHRQASLMVSRNTTLVSPLRSCIGPAREAGLSNGTCTWRGHVLPRNEKKSLILELCLHQYTSQATESTSNLCCRVANDFTHFTVHTASCVRRAGESITYTGGVSIIWPSAVFS